MEAIKFLKKENIFKFFKFFVFFASLIYFFYFIYENEKFFDQIKNFSPVLLLAIVMLKILNNLFLAKINIYILKNLSIELDILKSLEITTRNTLGNMVSPFKLGTGYKISFLKNFYNLNIPNYIYVNSLYAIFNLFPVLLIFLLFAIIFADSKTYIYVIFIGILVFSFLIFIYVKNLFGKKNLFAILNQVNLISINNLKIQVNNLLLFFSGTLITFLIIYELNSELLFFPSITYNTLFSISGLVQLTPGNIGIKEGFIAFFNNLHQLSTYTIIITSFIERFISIVVLFLLQIYINFKN